MQTRNGHVEQDESGRAINEVITNPIVYAWVNGEDVHDNSSGEEVFVFVS